ncbi:uncharacterized protein UTRI_10672 [Ustilago trichophora]|uniref:Effector family protein Eff1 n=1 Tax=Ustilago trichophora TaxID=86804 RepID=A0A5C3E860_9BASI|nr:uncharacterized protein UTRI_10672 [Ustilago trichophora]
MAVILDALCLALVAFSTLAAAVLQPELTGSQTPHYESSLNFLRNRYTVPQDYPHLEAYSHILSGHPDGEAKAWELAGTENNGPVDYTMDGSERNIFATTRISGNSQLGRMWNLNSRDELSDVYAFWHIRKGKHKLLRLDKWPSLPAAQSPPQTVTLQSLLEKVDQSRLRSFINRF